MKKQRILIVDIDNTIADSRPMARRFLEIDKPHHETCKTCPEGYTCFTSTEPDRTLPDYESFYRELAYAKPFKWRIRLIKLIAFVTRAQVVFVTGRPRSTDGGYDLFLDTEYWLRQHYSDRYHVLCTRSSGDRRPSHVVKKEIINRFMSSDKCTRVLAIDDDKDCIGMYRKLGIKTLNVNWLPKV